MHEIESNQHLGGHKEERASFPDQFHTRVSKIHIPKILILERKEGRGRRRRRRLGERGALLLDAWLRGREKEREDCPLPKYLPLTLNAKGLNYS